MRKKITKCFVYNKKILHEYYQFLLTNAVFIWHFDLELIKPKILNLHNIQYKWDLFYIQKSYKICEYITLPLQDHHICPYQIVVTINLSYIYMNILHFYQYYKTITILYI